MAEAFLQGGMMMWPLALIGAGVLWLTARTTWLIRHGENRLAEAERSLQAILFWGAMSVVLGLLGTVTGWIVATRAIALAGSVDTVLLWGGIGVTLSTLTFGMWTFAIAALSWFVLRQWTHRVSARGRRPAAAGV